jgi:hypothetical protein
MNSQKVKDFLESNNLDRFFKRFTFRQIENQYLFCIQEQH